MLQPVLFILYFIFQPYMTQIIIIGEISSIGILYYMSARGEIKELIAHLKSLHMNLGTSSGDRSNFLWVLCQELLGCVF